MPIDRPADKQALTYRAAGVDIDAGEEVVERIKPLVARTYRKEVMAGLGGFDKNAGAGRDHHCTILNHVSASPGVP